MNALKGLLAAAVVAAAAPAFAATDFPTKPVTIVVPFDAGGASDTVTRILGDELQKLWKQPVVIENKPGGGTIVGIGGVAKAAPDGYTMAMVSGSFTVNAATRSKLPYDTLKDFKGITVFIDAPQAITASPAFGPNSLAELIAEAKKRPADKPITFATSGIATPSHLFAELLQAETGIKLQHVPYSGGAAALPDVLAGRVDFQMGPWSDAKPHVDSGKLKLISTLYEKRLPEAPNTLTVGEVVPSLVGFPMGAWNAIVIPSGVPDDVTAKIAEGMQTVTKSESFQSRIRQLGTNPTSATPAETDEHLKRLVTEFTKIAKAQNIKVD